MTTVEWVETTAKTIAEAKNQALDQLGVGDEDAEFEILEEPRAGLFGLIRGEARVRARVRPTAVRPKQDRRRGRRERGSGEDDATETATAAEVAVGAAPDNGDGERGGAPARSGRGRGGDSAERGGAPANERPEPTGESVDPAAVGDAAARFVEGLVNAFGFSGTTSVVADGTDIEVRVDGDGMGLLIGPGGRTLLAVQDITRVAAQRRLGDHDTRLRVDVAGYRERRRVALERFAQSVAEQVRSSGDARALEPMPSADRKIIHDTLAEVEGVTSRSEGEDPDRRVIVSPA
jgi:spoIIIJ-associated protein